MTPSDDIAERNARKATRAEYNRFLIECFGDLDMLLLTEGEDRVNLRRVYVPLHIDTRDNGDDSIGGPEGLCNECAPGRDAREVITEEPFVVISGRPGNGRTTLVRAIITDLAGEGDSPLRRALTADRGILPIPLILRTYQSQLDEIRRLEDLLRLWWDWAQKEAKDKGLRLDVPRLLDSCSVQGDRIPLLVLFDGIDEVGGIRRREAVLGLAYEVTRHGGRARTGCRPAGRIQRPVRSVSRRCAAVSPSAVRVHSRAAWPAGTSSSFAAVPHSSSSG